jgi:hypothetical protein
MDSITIMMIKTLLIISALSILVSCSYFNKDEIEIKNEKLSVTQATSFDVDKAQMGGKITEASVHGEIKNISDKVLKNIVLTYKFPRKKVQAKIKLLKPGQTLKFVTTRYKAVAPRPDFKLDNVTYDKN